ncbi:F0F1 ATP synthase subunit B [Actinomycetospora sp. TBRC 11914]|uniref:F0F1 ATP synthase subunit B n=1 Tax=Actinomycetospora sp. TBRC 11914 TaxID=2729387 RepID=UPI00145F9846|nr:F0F1 ATP synthase subunit B [Actinomycetospora sp. TBRC 11914]NMO91267.1 F0F1 ATP synthase subunit B [Actinomycetospora sp. TBRC 11914]
MVSTIIAEIVAFLIVIYVIYRYVVPPLKQMTEKREKEIAQQVEDARKARERLEQAEAAYREAVDNAQNDAARIRDDARADAQRIADEMREKAEQEVERLRRRGEEALENARSQVVRELKAELGHHSTELASRLVRQELESDQAKKESVDSFIDELQRSVSSN